MSFKDFSKYYVEFTTLDLVMPNIKNQQKYYNRWMQKYATVFKNEDSFVAMEWDLRCQKSLREIFSSATFLIEAKKNLDTGCFSSYYFCLYYALFHAIYSTLFLDEKQSLKNLINITHKKMIDTFMGTFANSKKDILSKEVKALFYELKHRREYYSYVTPFNNMFDHKDDIIRLQTVLIQCYQLSNFHSLMVEKSFNKNKGVVKKINTIEEQKHFYELFNLVFAKKDFTGKSTLDESSLNLRSEFMKWGFKPTCIALDLEHQFDEFHCYDHFYENLDDCAVKITDIWNVLYCALVH